MCDIDALIAELQSKCDELDSRAQQLRAHMNEIRSEYQQMLRQHQEKFRSVEREHDAALRELNATRARFEQLSALKRTTEQERLALRSTADGWLEHARRVVYSWLRERLVDDEDAIKLRQLADHAPVEPVAAEQLRKLALALEEKAKERRLQRW